MNEQGAYQSAEGERAKELYEHLDALAAALSEHRHGDALQDELWHVVWCLTGPDPAKFAGARRWLKARDPGRNRVATVDDASPEAAGEERSG